MSTTTCPARPVYASRLAPDLVEGDVVLAHGARLRLVAVTRFTGAGGLEVSSWSTECLNLPELREAGADRFLVAEIERGGRGWVVQGNRLSSWAVEVDVEALSDRDLADELREAVTSPRAFEVLSAEARRREVARHEEAVAAGPAPRGDLV